MASLKNCFKKTPGAWNAAKAYQDEDGGYFLGGARWKNPDTTKPLTGGPAAFLARIGPGQVLAIAEGGIYAADPPEPDPEP